MGINYRLQYHEVVLKEDIPALPRRERGRVRRAIEERLTTHPDLYGKPLRRSLAGYRKLRVGDYRVIFRIEGVVVTIFVIGHRSKVYLMADKRQDS